MGNPLNERALLRHHCLGDIVVLVVEEVLYSLSRLEYSGRKSKRQPKTRTSNGPRKRRNGQTSADGEGEGEVCIPCAPLSTKRTAKKSKKAADEEEEDEEEEEGQSQEEEEEEGLDDEPEDEGD